MKSADEFIGEIETLRGRIASLSAAILRISASLDVDTVLNEIAQAARALTGARYAVITAIDDAGQLEDFVMSGLTPDERQRLLEWPEAMQIFEHLRDLPSPRASAGPARLHPRTRLFRRPVVHPVLPGRADAPSRHPGRQLLPRREGRRTGVHRRGRRAPGAVRRAGGDGDRQRAHAPRRAAGPLRPRRPGRHLAGRRRGVRCPDRPSGVSQSGDQAHPRGSAHSGPSSGRVGEGVEVPALRRARDRPPRVPPGRGAEQCRDGAGRGDRALGRRRAAGHDPGQRHADPLCRRCGRVGGGYPAGHGAARGAGAAAGRVPGHGEPRAAGAADLDQGLDHHCAGRLAGPGAGRGASVLPHHRRAGRPHGRPDQRPSRCGAPRHGHSVGRTRARGGGRPGGPGAQHVPLRRRQAHPPHRPAAGAAPGDGRRAAHRPGSEQPLLQCGEILSGVLPHPGRGGARWRSRRDLGLRRGPGGAAGTPPAPVPQVCRRRRWEARGRGGRAGARHLQGAGGGPRGPHLGDERRAGPGHTVHLHAPGGRGGLPTGSRPALPGTVPARPGPGRSRRAFWSWTTIR